MSTTTSIGSNTGQIYYTNTDTVATIRAALDAFMTAHGWLVHDASASSNSGVVYRAGCADVQLSANITTTSGSPSATVAGATPPSNGQTVVGTGIPANTTISNVGGVSGAWTCTLSANATASGTVAATFSSTKYVQVMFDPTTVNWTGSAGIMAIRMWEQWNSTTHIGTYGASISSDLFGAGYIPATTVANMNYDQPLAIGNGGQIYISANAKWFAVLSKTNSGQIGDYYTNSFSGCFEHSIDNSGDPKCWPPFIYTSGAKLANVGGPARGQFSYTRLKNRSIASGQSADNLGNVFSCLGSPAGRPDCLPIANNPYTNLPYVFTINVVPSNGPSVNGSDSLNAGRVRGRMYGLKFLSRNVGALLDTINLKVDANGFLDSTQATGTDHLVLGCGAAGYNLRLALPL